MKGYQKGWNFLGPLKKTCLLLAHEKPDVNEDRGHVAPGGLLHGWKSPLHRWQGRSRIRSSWGKNDLANLTPEERKIIYEEEKARIESQPKIETRKRADKVTKWIWPSILTLFVVSFLFAIGYFIFQTFQELQPVPSKKIPPEKYIDYTVLRRWRPGRNGTGMDILVSPTATKDEVMRLAEKLRDDYGQTGFVVLSIFDLREAWVDRQNNNYPGAKFWKHYLVQVWCPPLGGQEEIRWVAEGREEPKR